MTFRPPIPPQGQVRGFGSAALSSCCCRAGSPGGLRRKEPPTGLPVLGSSTSPGPVEFAPGPSFSGVLDAASKPEAVPPAALRRRSAVRLPRPPPSFSGPVPSRCPVMWLLHDCPLPGGQALRGPCDLQARSPAYETGSVARATARFLATILLLGALPPVKGAGLSFPAMWRLT